MGMEKNLHVLLTPEIIPLWEETKKNILRICEVFEIPEALSPISGVECMVRLAFHDGKMQGHKDASDDFKKSINELQTELRDYGWN